MPRMTDEELLEAFDDAPGFVETLHVHARRVRLKRRKCEAFRNGLRVYAALGDTRHTYVAGSTQLWSQVVGRIEGQTGRARLSHDRGKTGRGFGQIMRLLCPIGKQASWAAVSLMETAVEGGKTDQTNSSRPSTGER